MGRLARRRAVVERRALVEERRFRGVEVFGRRVLVERPAPERHDPPGEIADRKHHPVAETVIGHGDVVAVDQQPGLDHVLDGDAEIAEMLLEGEALGRRVADAEFHLGRRIEPAVGEVAARLGAGTPGERRLEERRGLLAHVMQGVAAALLGLGFPRELGHRHAGERSQPLHRLGEGDALGLHHEGEDVAMLAGREVVVEALLIVDEERRRALLVEGRQALPFAARLAQLDPLADDLRYRKPGAQLIEKLRRKAHG